jgi:hypothetical protein
MNYKLEATQNYNHAKEQYERSKKLYEQVYNYLNLMKINLDNSEKILEESSIILQNVNDEIEKKLFLQFDINDTISIFD